MSAVIKQDNEVLPYPNVNFISQQDIENHKKLKKEIDDHIGEASSINAIRIRDGKGVMSFYDYRAYQLLHPVNESLLANQISVIDTATLRDYFHYTHQIYIVSERFKFVIESIEPEVHYFKSLELVNQQGEHLAHYYFFRCLNLLDTLDPESEGLTKENEYFTINQRKDSSYFYYELNPFSDNEVRIKKEKIKNKACFYELHCDETSVSVPDEVKNILEERGIGSLEYDPIFTEC